MYYNKTQHANFQGLPLFQATKQHLTVKWWKMRCRRLIYCRFSYLPFIQAQELKKQSVNITFTLVTHANTQNNFIINTNRRNNQLSPVHTFTLVTHTNTENQVGYINYNTTIKSIRNNQLAVTLVRTITLVIHKHR